MTTQRSETKAAAIAIAARRAEAAASVDAAENEGLHIWAPSPGVSAFSPSDTVQHAMLDGNRIAAEPALAPHTAAFSPPPSVRVPIAKLPRTIGSFRIRAKWRPVR